MNLCRSSFWWLLLTLIFLYILAGCGEVTAKDMAWVEPNKFNFPSDPYFDVYKRSWEKDTGLSVGSSIVFEDLGAGTTLALCRYFKSNPQARAIFIDKNKWYTLTDAQKEVLIYHEIGHCDLQQFVHRNDWMIDGCPYTIMRPEIFTPWEIIHCYTKHKKHYIRELLEYKNG